VLRISVGETPLFLRLLLALASVDAGTNWLAVSALNLFFVAPFESGSSLRETGAPPASPDLDGPLNWMPSMLFSPWEPSCGLTSPSVVTGFAGVPSSPGSKLPEDLPSQDSSTFENF
jgi:hypothetical protein